LTDVRRRGRVISPERGVGMVRRQQALASLYRIMFIFSIASIVPAPCHSQDLGQGTAIAGDNSATIVEEAGDSLTPGPAAATSDCFPPCLPGYVCRAGECRPACDPPCPQGLNCDGQGYCVSAKTPAYAPVESVKARPPAAAAKVNMKQSPRFNPFIFGKTISFGPVISEFYYRELNLLNESAQQFFDAYNRVPVIVGQPRSVEHGLLTGFNFNYTRVSAPLGIFFRPHVTLLPGLFSTYDGSTQADALTDELGDTIGMVFEPVEIKKVNIFFHGGFQLGFCNGTHPVAFSLYSGLNAKIWYRSLDDMTATDNIVSTNEVYSWINVPIGGSLYLPMGPRWVFGIDLAIECMIAGMMSINQSITDPDMKGVEFDYPNVTLGNKAGYKLELAFQGRVTDNMSLRIAPYTFMYGFGKSNVERYTISGGGGSYSNDFFEPASGTVGGGIMFSFGFMSTPLKSKAW
jgi:hypothetical protein